MTRTRGEAGLRSLFHLAKYLDRMVARQDSSPRVSLPLSYCISFCKLPPPPVNSLLPPKPDLSSRLEPDSSQSRAQKI